MSGQICMQIDKKNVIDAICKANGWQCVYYCSTWCILGRDSLTAIFICRDKDNFFRYFPFLDDLYYVMTHADEIFVDNVFIKNPYVGMTNEQIFIKCDLEMISYES